MVKYQISNIKYLLLLFAILTLPSLSFAQMSRVNASTASDISRFCICRSVTNGGAKDVMVPYNTQLEFTDFIAAPPPGVTLAVCATGNYGPPAYALSGGSGGAKGFSTIGTISNLSSIASCNLNISVVGVLVAGCVTYALKNGVATSLSLLPKSFSFAQGDTIQLEACCTSANAYSKTPVIRNDFGDILSTVNVAVTAGSAASCP